MESSTSTGRVRLGIIGTGNIARLHVEGLATIPELAEIVAVADVDEERARAFAARHGGTPYANLEDLLNQGRPDAVLVCTPNYLHAPVSISALQAGVHVFCEKPIATSRADAELMKKAEEQAGRVLYIGFNHRFVGKFALARQILESGEFGRVLAARVAAGHDGYARLAPWFRERAKSGGGTLLDNGVHFIDLLRWLGHGITEVSAQMTPIPPEYGDVEDNAIALFRLGDGGIATLLCSWRWPPRYQFQFHMICEGGTIDLTGEDVVLLRSGSKELETLDTPDTNIWIAQMKRFLAAVRGEEPPFATADDGIAALEVILAAYESNQTGRTLSIEALPAVTASPTPASARVLQ